MARKEVLIFAVLILTALALATSRSQPYAVQESLNSADLNAADEQEDPIYQQSPDEIETTQQPEPMQFRQTCGQPTLIIPPNQFNYRLLPFPMMSYDYSYRHVPLGAYHIIYNDFLPAFVNRVTTDDSGPDTMFNTRDDRRRLPVGLTFPTSQQAFPQAAPASLLVPAHTGASSTAITGRCITARVLAKSISQKFSETSQRLHKQ